VDLAGLLIRLFPYCLLLDSPSAQVAPPGPIEAPATAAPSSAANSAAIRLLTESSTIRSANHPTTHPTSENASKQHQAVNNVDSVPPP